MSTVTDFVFRGMLARNSVDEMRKTGILRMPAASAEAKWDQDLYAPVPETIRLSSIEMQRCYRLLFVFENLIREFVEQRFSEEASGADWFDARASSQMKQKVVDRKAKELRSQWHTGRNAGPLFYLDFGDLGQLMINHWSVFTDFFDGQAWVKSRIDEAERSRNVIAHTNVLADDEIARLEMYARDWMKQTI